jgi:hypothetical protein
VSIYPLDRNKRYTTPGGLKLFWCVSAWIYSDNPYGYNEAVREEHLKALFGESLTPVVEMTEVTVEFDGHSKYDHGNISLMTTETHSLPMLQPGTTAYFTLTMRYPQGSKLNSEQDDK